MIQLELEMFFPLTEQITLDLDYNKCERPKLWTNSSFLVDNSQISWTTTNTIQFHTANDSAGYWKVGEGLQMHNKKRPSWLHQKMTKIFFDWEWRDNG